ncbi:MAG: DUF1849 domain-containing protein [Micavibrio aeruginosavorus]|uniref:DUF1849 domain-containing protein n=1 Tax=Micavibrio aeruginosavorus TaxID=349221 RepID=A0A2W5HFU2_9BACT|nr:MAG: DUF1849 domain-containing protein [Micavibrio aeruginosavorus]
MPGRVSTPFLMTVLAVLTISTQVLAAGPVVVSPAQALTPHKALYDVQLVSTKSGSQMANISGKMFYEWKPSCEGWITNHRFSLNYDYADSPSINISSDFTTFETFDGKSLNFSSRRKRNGETYEELRGSADLTAKGISGTAIYSIPENLTFDLARNTLFPTGHTLNLLEQARQGKKFYNVRIFDGSDDEGPVDINSFIGTKIEGKKSGEASKISPQKSNSFKPASTNSVDNSLIDVPGWNVRMAFFPTNATEPSSDYELSMVFHENGIISDMMIEYADFTVRQKLVALEKVTPESCKN